jgi:hypothetical protein
MTILAHDEGGRRVWFLLHDRDAKFCRSFDDVFGAEGGEVLVTLSGRPRRTRMRSAGVCTVGAECLDWLLIVGRGRVGQVLRIDVEHCSDTARTERSGCSADCCTSTGQGHERLYDPSL